MLRRVFQGENGMSQMQQLSMVHSCVDEDALSMVMRFSIKYGHMISSEEKEKQKHHKDKENNVEKL